MPTQNGRDQIMTLSEIPLENQTMTSNATNDTGLIMLLEEINDLLPPLSIQPCSSSLSQCRKTKGTSESISYG